MFPDAIMSGLIRAVFCSLKIFSQEISKLSWETHLHWSVKGKQFHYVLWLVGKIFVFWRALWESQYLKPMVFKFIFFNYHHVVIKPCFQTRFYIKQVQVKMLWLKWRIRKAHSLFPSSLLFEWPQSISEEFLQFHKHSLQMIPLTQWGNCWWECQVYGQHF